MSGLRPGKTKGPWVGSVIAANEVTGALNVGTGTGLSFINRVGHDLVFRSIKQGANITVTNNAQDITIAATVPFTAIANVGTGTGLVWRDTIAGTVNLKTIKQGSNITVTNNADDITITATVAFTGIANVGTGTGTVWRDTIAGTINLKTIKQGTGITVTNNADDITVTCTITQGITAVANVGTGTGLVWRDTVAGTANLKSIKQGTGITVTNNADDITITSTITQGPTGSGTNPYLAYWSAGTVLGSAGVQVSGNDLFWINLYKALFGNTTIDPVMTIYGSNVSSTGFITSSAGRQITIQGDGANKLIIGPVSTDVNQMENDYDTNIYGANATATPCLKIDAALNTAMIQQRLVIKGVIDNAGSPYAGGSSGAPTSLNLSLIANTGSVIRIAPTSEANRFYKIINPQNYQIIIIHNESIYNAVIFADAAATYPFILIPPLHIASGTGNCAILQFNPNTNTGFGCWMQLDVQRQPISADLVDSATIAVDASYGDCQLAVTLGGNRTLGSPINPVHDGQKIVFRISQDNTGNRTLAYDTFYLFSTDLPLPTLSTGAFKIDYLGFIYNAGLNRWLLVGKVFGF